jgi:hypothetical protein
MSYDLYPLTTLENKKLWLPRAAQENWLCVFEHDPDRPFGRLVEEKPGKYRVNEEWRIENEELKAQDETVLLRHS